LRRIIVLKINFIETERLLIIPVSYSILCSILCSILSRDYTEIKNLGITLNEKWPLSDTIDILYFLKDILKDDTESETEAFGLWMIIRKKDMAIIGDIGFKGKPNSKFEVEIGFGIIDDEQKNGYGYESVSALLKWILQKDNVKLVKANCLLDNKASIKLLKKCGMKELKRDNSLIYWETNCSKI
jgi:RimJ/RimL family protein N-acetyltransferase